MAKNKITCLEAEVIFEGVDGYKISVHPFHVYTVFSVDTVTFKLIALPKESGLCILTSKAEDLEVDGVTYTMQELPLVLQDKFAESGAQMRAEVVSGLPESGRTNTIYLVPRETPEGGTVYDEYIWLKSEQRWELVGDTSIEMYRYLTKADFAVYSALTEDKIDFISGAVDTLSGETMTLSGETMTISGDLLSHVADMVVHITAEERASWNEVSGKASQADFNVLSGQVETLDGEITILSGAIDEKQDILVSGENIKTINSQSILGSGNIDLDVTGKTDESAFTAHTADTVVHTNAEEKAAWNEVSGKAEQSDFVALSGKVDENEEVTARALNDLDERLIELSGSASGASEDIEAISGVVSSHTSNSDIHVTTSDKAAWNAKVDVADLADFFDYAEYDSGTTRINFKHGGSTGSVIAYIDATDFIIDGMVDDVFISGGNLVITFNTDAGKQDISIPLTDIFNPSNYYDKTATDALLSAKTNNTDFAILSGQVEVDEQVSAAALNELNARVVELSGSASGASADIAALSGIVADKADTSAVTSAIEAATSGKADTSAVTTAINAATSGKAEQSDLDTLSGQVQTIDEVAARGLVDLNAKVITLSGSVSGADADIAALSGVVADKADITAVTAMVNARLINVARADANWAGSGVTYLSKAYDNGSSTSFAYLSSINNKAISTSSNDSVNKFSLVETSAITTSITDASTDAQVPSALAVYNSISGKADTSAVTSAITDAVSGKADESDLVALSGQVQTIDEVAARGLTDLDARFGGLKLVQLTSTQYESLQTKDANTLYIIVGD